MRTTLALALLGLLTLAPAALADGTEEKPACPEGYVESPEGCSRQAWVDDCPPDMMCAMGNGTAGPDEPVQYGPDGCIDCSGPIHSHTCMDGAQEGEACRDDVQYLDGGAEPVRGPMDGSCENCRGEQALSQGTRDAPGLGAAAVLGLAALAVAFARRR